MYELVIPRSVEKDIKRLPRQLQKIIANEHYEAKSKQLINGVQVKQLRWIPDEQGKLMEMLRCDDPMFEKFGQVYITTCYPGVVKDWHYHQNCSPWLQSLWLRACLCGKYCYPAL